MTSLRYKVSIVRPETHYVSLSLRIPKNLIFQAARNEIIEVFMPVWSPGSYLVREYSRNIFQIKALNNKGEYLELTQNKKNSYQIKIPNLNLKIHSEDFEFIEIEYEVYAHELTVRTSHVTNSHAFLHGPSLFLGVQNLCDVVHQLELVFPTYWTSLTVSLPEISEKREHFCFQATSYDHLLDSPIEIGTHERRYFKIDETLFSISFWGQTETLERKKLEEDLKKICTEVMNLWGETPFEFYDFILHFAPNARGGLEHSYSSVNLFDPRILAQKKNYDDFLSLLAHEFFHAWNVKRLRPKPLGPFNYHQEVDTSLLWFAEGMTSFADDWIILKTGFFSLEEYLNVIKENLNRYFAIPGKKIHSLKQSSFNAWIKLYRPDENSSNSSISYYLKGGLTFLALNFLFCKKQVKFSDFLKHCWMLFQQRPEQGFDEQEIYTIVEKLAGQEVREIFVNWIETCEEIPFESLFRENGIKCLWKKQAPVLGAELKAISGSVFVEKVSLDSAAFKAGLNAGDEILAFNSWRFLPDCLPLLSSWLEKQATWDILVAREGKLLTLRLMAEQGPIQLEKLLVEEKEEGKVKQVFELN